jgi:arylformamidase
LIPSLTKPKVTFIALPLKVAGGDGAPARDVAIEED